MKQFTPFQFLVAPQVIVDRVFVFCEGPHVTMSSLCVLSHVSTRACHCILSRALSILLNVHSIFLQNGEHSSVPSETSEADLRKI